MKNTILFFVLVFSTRSAYASQYSIDYDASFLTFSGTHAGTRFTGVFNDWGAQVLLNPDASGQHSIKASFKTGSATTGNKLYDGTLPQADWFDVENHTTAEFQSTEIIAEDNSRFTAIGDLTMLGITQEISFDFTLDKLEGKSIALRGQFPVDRLAFGMGKKSDPHAAWVSRDILISLNLVLNNRKE